MTTLDKRMTRAEDRIDGHERECVLRYEGIKTMFEEVRDTLEDFRNILGKSPDEGLQGKVGNLKSTEDKRAGMLVVAGAVLSFVLLVAGWVVPLALDRLF